MTSKRIAERIAQHGPIARVLVAGTRGSAPRGPGAEMLVWQSGTEGSIGGGRLEFEAIATARGMLAKRSEPRLTRHALGPELGQCCGGAVTLLTEILSSAPPEGLRLVGPPPPELERIEKQMKRGEIPPVSVIRETVVETRPPKIPQAMLGGRLFPCWIRSACMIFLGLTPTPRDFRPKREVQTLSLRQSLRV